MFYTIVRRPVLFKFHLDRVRQAHSYTDKTFHCLVTLRHLARWELGPEPTEEALAHELTNQRRKFSPWHFYYLFRPNPNIFSSFLQEWQP